MIPTREEIESHELHRESNDQQKRTTNGDYDLLDTIPLVALGLVFIALAVIFAFATLGG